MTGFLQIHTLTSYPASLLNRDDAGFAKRMPFGGAVRTRVSSQCLKRHWRTHNGEGSLHELGIDDSVRSREIFRRLVLPRVIEASGDETRAKWAVAAMVALLQAGTQAKAKKKRKSIAERFIGVVDDSESFEQRGRARKPKEEEAQRTDAEVDALKQIVVLGPSEIEFLVAQATLLAKGDGKNEELVELAQKRATNDEKVNLETLARSVTMGAGLSAALFGRMRTGDLFAETNAAIHVAHAMTVHGQMTESDYFSAIDDLIREEGEQESGHINASELTSGVFYGYVVVDVAGLVANVGGDRQLAGDVVHKLMHMVATVSPGAKKGSTAPYAYSHLVLIESGKAQPRTLQNAFIEPVKTSGNVIDNAYGALAQHLSDLDGMYGKSEERAHAGLRTNGLFEQRMNLAGLADWGKGRVLE